MDKHIVSRTLIHAFKLYIFFIGLFFAPFMHAVEDNFLIDLGTLESELEHIYSSSPKISLFPPDEDYGMNETKKVVLSSVTLEFHKHNNHFYLYRFRISGSGWSYRNSGVFIGAQESKIIEHLGNPETREADGDIMYLFYRLYNFDAWTRISIRDGKVIEIFASEDWA